MVIFRQAAIPARRAAFFAHDGLTFQRKIQILCHKTLKQRVIEKCYALACRLISPAMRKQIKCLIKRGAAD